VNIVQNVRIFNLFIKTKQLNISYFNENLQKSAVSAED